MSYVIVQVHKSCYFCLVEEDEIVGSHSTICLHHPAICLPQKNPAVLLLS